MVLLYLVACSSPSNVIGISCGHCPHINNQCLCVCRILAVSISDLKIACDMGVYDSCISIHVAKCTHCGELLHVCAM